VSVFFPHSDSTFCSLPSVLADALRFMTSFFSPLILPRSASFGHPGYLLPLPRTWHLIPPVMAFSNFPTLIVLRPKAGLVFLPPSPSGSLSFPYKFPPEINIGNPLLSPQPLPQNRISNKASLLGGPDLSARFPILITSPEE